jgi:hypothetical protein
MYHVFLLVLGEETCSKYYPSSRGVHFIGHKSLAGRRKSIHPGADLPDITMAANHTNLGTPLKQAEVLHNLFCVLLVSNI